MNETNETAIAKMKRLDPTAGIWPTELRNEYPAASLTGEDWNVLVMRVEALEESYRLDSNAKSRS
jgi:hypothetical protein